MGRTHLERSPRWAGLRPGDGVEVADVHMRRATWTFLAHVRNVTNNEEWIEVVGGRAGERTVRSFRPSQIFAPGQNPAGRLSLSEEPRLPFA